MHGRLDTHTGGTDVDGNPIDDWGFEGPEFNGIKSVDFTYGVYTLIFKNKGKFTNAKLLTGWRDGVHELSLEMEIEDDCIRIHNAERSRKEYFGDFILREG